MMELICRGVVFGRDVRLMLYVLCEVLRDVCFLLWFRVSVKVVARVPRIAARLDEQNQSGIGYCVKLMEVSSILE